jgi:hypothetical protein
MKTIRNILQAPRRGVFPGCAAIANLLPLLNGPELNAEEKDAVLAHLASCSACRERQAEYRRLERDARRYLSPQSTLPRYQTEDLLAQIMTEDLIASSSSDIPAPIRRPHRPVRRRGVTALAPAAAILVVVLLAAALFSGHFGGLGAGGSSLLFGSQTELTSISMISSTEGWAVGYTQSSVDDPGGIQGLMLHYLHGVWSPVPINVNGYLYNVSMVSATEGWADGAYAGSQPLLLHYDGKTWKRVKGLPQLGHIQMLSATDGWATGYGNYLWHYDGNHWTRQTSPASLISDASLDTNTLLTMTSAVDGWLVDNGPNNSSAVFLHYSHGHWQVSQRIEGAQIGSISMASSTDGWAMGGISKVPTVPQDAVSPTPLKPLLLHYTHGKWVQVKSPASASYWVTVAMRSSSDGWMADVGANTIPHLFHYNGSDWSRVRVPLTADNNTDRIQISGFALTAADDGWAIGMRTSNSNQSAPLDSQGDYVPLVTPFILHYSSGAWSVVPLRGIPYYPV